ncbi:MAG: hypothetical protein AAGJ46_04805 [Planctomycetota bacterium]
MAAADENPFVSPEADELLGATPTATPSSQQGSWRLVRCWVVVELLNMPMPAMFGWGGTSPLGRIGMAVGIATLVATGAAITRQSRMIGQSLCIGCAVVALTQLAPMPHMILGMLAMDAMEVVGIESRFPGGGSEPGYGLAGGLLATLFVGVGLAASGLIVGYPLRMLGSRLGGRPQGRFDDAVADAD